MLDDIALAYNINNSTNCPIDLCIQGRRHHRSWRVMHTPTFFKFHSFYCIDPPSSNALTPPPLPIHCAALGCILCCIFCVVYSVLYILCSVFCLVGWDFYLSSHLSTSARITGGWAGSPPPLPIVVPGTITAPRVVVLPPPPQNGDMSFENILFQCLSPRLLFFASSSTALYIADAVHSRSPTWAYTTPTRSATWAYTTPTDQAGGQWVCPEEPSHIGLVSSGWKKHWDRCSTGSPVWHMSACPSYSYQVTRGCSHVVPAWP